MRTLHRTPSVGFADYRFLSKEGLDLAFKLLSLDPERRPTAAEALQHPYFTRELPRPERPTGYPSLKPN
jgi:serine/threonine protein kinase